MSNLEDVQDLLDKAKKYREENIYPPKINEEERFKPDLEIKFLDNDVVEFTSSGVIQEKYYITQEEAKNGCTKTLTYTKLNRFHKEIETSIDFEIPKGTKNRQEITLEGKGNYMADNRYSDLIIKIIIR